MKAWKIEEGSFKCLSTLSRPEKSAMTWLASAGVEMVFAGCHDGGIVAWNPLEDKDDILKTEGAAVSFNKNK